MRGSGKPGRRRRLPRYWKAYCKDTLRSCQAEQPAPKSEDGKIKPKLTNQGEIGRVGSASAGWTLSLFPKWRARTLTPCLLWETGGLTPPARQFSEQTLIPTVACLSPRSRPACGASATTGGRRSPNPGTTAPAWTAPARDHQDQCPA